jgi:hypothetical protein
MQGVANAPGRGLSKRACYGAMQDVPALSRRANAARE